MSTQARAPIELLANALYLCAGLLLTYALLAWLLALPAFDLRHIDIRGQLKHVDEAQIKLLGSRNIRGNFFTAELDDVRAAFEKLPWVDAARVSRRWPDRLVVELEEHQPLAIWNGRQLVSVSGRVFNALPDRPLPELNGADASAPEVSRTYRAFSARLAPLGMQIRTLSLSPRHAWRLKTDTGLEIALGRQDAEPRLARLAASWTQMVERLGAVPVYADLRYSDGFALRLPTAVATTPAHRVES